MTAVAAVMVMECADGWALWYYYTIMLVFYVYLRKVMSYVVDTNIQIQGLLLFLDVVP